MCPKRRLPEFSLRIVYRRRYCYKLHSQFATNTRTHLFFSVFINIFVHPFQKYTLVGLLAMCLSATAVPEPSGQLLPATLDFAQTKNTAQRADEAKPSDVVPIYLYARENSLDGDYNFR